MKNTDIQNLDKGIIPIKIRLEVYKEALEHITNNIWHQSEAGFSLCLLLPSLLWDLNSYLSLAPDGQEWVWAETPLAFPELTDTILSDIKQAAPNDGFYMTEKERNKEKNIIRVKFLEDSIKLLTFKD